MSGTTADPRPVGARAAPKKALRLSWSDPVFRAIVWQVVIVGLVVLIVWYLVGNTNRNLSARHIATGLAFLQRVAGIRIARRDAPEVGAGAGLVARLLGARARLRNALRGRLVGQSDQDVRDVVLDALAADALLVFQVEVDLRLADLDPLVDLAFAQPLHDDLPAHFLAELVDLHAVALERLAKRGERHVVVLGDALDRAIELQLIDAQSAFGGELQLRLVEDQPLEHLALEHAAVGRRSALPLQLALGERDSLAQLARRHDFLVDDRHDAIDELQLLRERARAAGQRQTEYRQEPHDAHG